MKCIDCNNPISASTPPVVVKWGDPPELPHLGRKIAQARCLDCNEKLRGKTPRSTGAVPAVDKKEKAAKSPKAFFILQPQQLIL
jgi:hypothetical protein